MIRVPTHRQPTHPGEMLVEEFLKPMKLSQRDLSQRIRVPYQRVNELIKPPARHYAGYGLASCQVFWRHACLLDESSAPLGSLSRTGGRSFGVARDTAGQADSESGLTSK